MRLAEIALVGLARVGDVPAEAPLVGRLPSTSRERSLLLSLGVEAIRARAGRRAGQGVAPPPAGTEARPACSEALAQLMVEQCRERNLVLLKEALLRLDQLGLRLPPWCLVDLAELKQASLQPAAARVAGERGRWLAAQNPEWRWLLEGPAADTPEERRRIWEEGGLAERLSVLRATRADDGAAARAWVEAVWKEEKATVREELLVVLEAGLGAEDETFLEGRALTDRAAPVRARAAQMLSRLEGSGLAQRMRQRAEALLRYQPPEGLRGLLGALKARLGGDAAGSLDVTPPASFPPEWAADGLVEKPPAGKGEKAFWVAQVLALVPPDHWVRRFDASPDVLIAAAARGDWAAAIVEGWLQAAVSFRSGTWAAALWRGQAKASVVVEQVAPMATRILPLVPQEEAESLVAPLIAAGDPALFLPLLPALARPWGQALAGTFLQAFERALHAPAPNWQEAIAWRGCLERAALALPPTSFARALALPGPEDANPLRNALDQLRRVVSLRQRIHEETRP
jgi:hypothetical protein